MAPVPESTRKKLSASARFFKSEVGGSILLLICTIVALAWANSAWSAYYFELLGAKIGFAWNDLSFRLSWGHWINDGLMALFFFVVGLEIKREVAVGELSTVRKAILPVAAAVGGMIVPALIYLAINRTGEGARGWGIPMATDIAFALGILALLGDRVPAGLKLFLTALAIADDLGAVLVIALFYTSRVSTLALLGALVCLCLIGILSWRRVTSVSPYAALVAGVWVCVLVSGIHATIAGILVAMVVPVRARIQPDRFFAVVREKLAELETSRFGSGGSVIKAEEIERFEDLSKATSDAVPAGIVFERYLHPVTAFAVLPVFALFNAGVVLDENILKALLTPVGLGVVAGLVLGKQIGITLASWVVIRLKLAEMPAGMNWKHIFGAAALAGVGFTMALFVSELALEDPRLLAASKIGILAASAVSGLVGYAVLRSAFKAEAR